VETLKHWNTNDKLLSLDLDLSNFQKYICATNDDALMISALPL
jgi:hypothetical protein